MVFLWCAAGFVVGTVLTAIFFRVRTGKGTLMIDHSNPEKDVVRFVIDDIEQITKKKRFILKVDHNANITQK